MQLTIAINQAAALDWGLNAQQALLLAFIERKAGRRESVDINKHEIVRELPILTDKPDTGYRLLKQLEAAGVLRLESCPGSTVARLTQRYIKSVEGRKK